MKTVTTPSSVMIDPIDLSGCSCFPEKKNFGNLPGGIGSFLLYSSSSCLPVLAVLISTTTSLLNLSVIYMITLSHLDVLMFERTRGLFLHITSRIVYHE